MAHSDSSAVVPRASDAKRTDNWANGVDVLAVDDNATNRLLIALYFKGAGANLRFAGNGQEAVELYRDSPADLILMDVSMPVLDGFQASGLIRLHEQEAGLRRATIVAVTANVMEQDRNDARLAGMDAFLGKPLRKKDVVALLATKGMVPGQRPGANSGILMTGSENGPPP